MTGSSPSVGGLDLLTGIRPHRPISGQRSAISISISIGISRRQTHLSADKDALPLQEPAYHYQEPLGGDLTLTPDLFCRRLSEWFDPTRRRRPWRDRLDPYAIWVAEVMLQQTVVTYAAARYEAWMSRFPTVAALAAADEREVLAAWEGLGYYSRARNLHRAAQIVMDSWRGELPDDHTVLRSLPGIGDYTAAAILAIAFDHPLAAVDANARRVIGRLLGADEISVWTTRRSRAFFADALAQARPSVLTPAVMEFGQTVCTVHGPRCSACPLTDVCVARQKGLAEAQPPRRRLVVQRRTELALLIRDGGEIFARKSGEKLFSGLWLLPTILVADNNSKRIEDLLSQLGATPKSVHTLPSVTHHFTDNAVKLLPLAVSVERHPLTGESNGDWLPIERLEEFAFPSAHRRIIQRWLASRLGTECLSAWVPGGRALGVDRRRFPA